MAFITTAAFVLGALGPQGPASTPPAAPAVAARTEPLRFLWPDTVGVVALQPTAPLESELAQTGLPALLDAQLEKPAVRDLMFAVTGWAEEELGLGSRELFDEVGRNGVTVGWRPSGDDTVTWIVAVGLEDSAKPLVESLDRAADSSTSVSVARANLRGASAWTVKVRDLQAQFVLAIVGDTMILAPSVAVAQRAVDRGSDPAAKSLANTPGFDAFRKRARTLDGSDPLVLGWLDLGKLVPNALADLPLQQRSEVTKWLGHLGLDHLGALGLSVTPQGGRVHERYLVEFPAPRPAWLEALLPSDAVIDPAVANLAPRDVVSFSVTHVRLAALREALMAVVQQASPDTAQQVTAMTNQLGAMAGVDLVEILNTLGDRIVTMQWADGDQVMVVDLADPRRLAIALRKMPSLKNDRRDTDELFLMPSGPAFAISRGELVVAQSEKRLRSWLDAQDSGVSNPTVLSIAQSMASNSISFGWSDFAAMTGALRQSVSIIASQGPADASQMLGALAGVAERLGQVTFDVSADDQGYVFHANGDVGGLTGLLAASLGSAAGRFSAGADLRAAAGRADALRSRRLQRLNDVLTEVRAAEMRHQQEHGGYATLATLIELGYVSESAFTDGPDGASRRYGDHVVAVLLDAPSAAAAQHFAVVAWPDENRRGDVYACSDRFDPMRNELIARSSGIGQIRTEDLFSGGKFDAPLAVGWRPLEVDKSSTTVAKTPAPVHSSAGERTRYETVAALEKRGPAAATELLPYLDDESPAVVARAAWALGEVKGEAAVPRLVQLVRDGSSLDVRRHALRALWKMHDPRSVRASIEALSDDDAQLREIAATNLGELRANEAKEHLLDLVGRTVDGDQHDDSDRAAALLALTAIGDPETLVPAATTLKDASKVEDQALAWMFQTLSPKLDQEREAKTLIAVLDDDSSLLRRYAIQRLGELRAKTAVKALESRLASESPELRGLVEVSLTAIRGVGPQGDAKLPFDVKALWSQARTQFEDPRIRAAAVAGLAALVVIAMMFVLLGRRRRRRLEAEQWASFVEPSDGFVGPDGRSSARPSELTRQFDIGSRR